MDDSPANSPTPFIGTFRNFSFDGGRYTDFELPDAAASSAGMPSLPTNQSANALEALEEEYSTDDITARSISLSCEKPIQSAVVGMTETMDRVESPDVFGRTPPFAMCSSQSPHAVSPLGVLGAMLQQRGLYTQEQAPIGDGTNTVAQTEIAAPPVDADIDDPPRVKVTQAEGEGKPTEATSATTFSFNPNAPAFVFNRG